VRHLRVAAIARDHEVVAVAEHQPRLIHRTQVEVARGTLRLVDGQRGVDRRRDRDLSRRARSNQRRN